MKQIAVIKKLRFVQIPTADSLYAIPSVANLPFRAFVPIAEQMGARGEWIESTPEIALDDTMPKEIPQIDAGLTDADRAARMTYAEAQVRQLCATRGLDWDAMTEVERESFVDDLIHEDRECSP